MSSKNPTLNCYCRMCLELSARNEATIDLKSDVRKAIETVFSSKMKIEPDFSFFVCQECEKTLMDFYGYFQRVLKNQCEYEKLLKTEIIHIDVKSEIVFESEDFVYSDDYQPLKMKKVKSRKKGKKNESANEVEEEQLIKQVFSLSCKDCSNTEFQTLHEFRTHLTKIHFKKLVLECCSRKFSLRYHILDHAMSHLNHEKLRCKHCGKQSSSRNNLKLHLLKHQPDQGMSCEMCGKIFTIKERLSVHMQVHLTADEKEKLKTHVCGTCTKAYTSRALLAQHIRQSHENAYSCVCDICAKVFKTKLNLLNHFKNVHGSPEKNRVQCDMCGSWCASKESLKNHMRNVHTPGPHFCSVCQKEFPTRLARVHHQHYTHQVTLHKCQYCEKAFKSAIKLKEHLTIHLGGSLYTCTYCEKTFNSSANMYSHRKKGHPEEWERDRIKSKMNIK